MLFICDLFQLWLQSHKPDAVQHEAVTFPTLLCCHVSFFILSCSAAAAAVTAALIMAVLLCCLQTLLEALSVATARKCLELHSVSVQPSRLP